MVLVFSALFISKLVTSIYRNKYFPEISGNVKKQSTSLKNYKNDAYKIRVNLLYFEILSTCAII